MHGSTTTPTYTSTDPDVHSPPYAADRRPYVRWWWFAEPISVADVDLQLDWLAANGFGGVEIAFVYPRDAAAPTPEFLGGELVAALVHCRSSCVSRGLAMDVTFGTLWPFGGSMVGEADASRTFAGPSPQRLSRSWEAGEGKEPGAIVNHLDRHALGRYSEYVGNRLAPVVAQSNGDEPIAAPICFFCDSWEVHVDQLWSDGFGDEFLATYGYRIEPFMDRLDDHPDHRYDYQRLLSTVVLREFYEPFARICSEHGALSRVQCHGAPTDLLAAYSVVDVPESETLLFDAPFSLIAASAAAQSGRPVVSCEAFTCLYGWIRHPGPGPHQRRERWQDIRMVGDSMIANGVNLFVWHGMPFRRNDEPASFYASIHVGPDAAFAPELPRLNAYFASLCRAMSEGRPHAPLAVYLPLEDSFMAGTLPDAEKRPSAEYHWEMHYERFPHESLAYRPIWTSERFLADAIVDRDASGSMIRLGEHAVRAVLVGADYLHRDVIASLVRIADAGGTVVLSRRPKQPGTRHDDYDRLVTKLERVAFASIDAVPAEYLAPVVTGDVPPEYWVRRIDTADGERLRLFFAHPAGIDVHYPMEYGYSDRAAALTREVVVHWAGRHAISLDFNPNEPILVEVDPDGTVDVTHCDFFDPAWRCGR